MHRYAKRFLSSLLCVSMLTSFLPSVFAAEKPQGEEEAYFDFEASEYEVREDAGELKVKIIRHGGTEEAADVSFKVADFLSDYGTDYVILDEDGNPLHRVEGQKPDPSQLLSDTEDADVISEEFMEEAKAAATGSTEEIAEPAEETTEPTEGVAESTEADLAEEVEEAEEPDLMRDEKKDEVKEVLNDFYSYFISAQGAGGTVHFKSGETEKTVTVQVIDNQASEADKIFMMALMDTDSGMTRIAANASTYVTITDDEQVEEISFDIADDHIVLSPEKPTSYVTIRRNSGTQYFSTVYLSTVKQTAKTSAYHSFEAKTLSFAPGETEKKVEVSAHDFSQDVRFGLRLEAQDEILIGRYYIDVFIKSRAEEIEDEKDEVDLAATTSWAGESTKTFGFSSMPGGWEKKITGRDNSNKASYDDSVMWVKNYDKGHESMYYTTEEQNLIGVKSISFRAKTENANGKDKTSYTTSVATDDDKNYDGIKDGEGWNGNKDWFESSFTLNNTGDSAYIRFAGHCNGDMKHNVYAQLKWLRYDYAKYTFSPQNSCESINRKVYDFTGSVLSTYDTFYDGEESRIYNPGSVIIMNGARPVNAFYPTSSNTVISAANQTKNAARGIYLKGVYFANDSMNKNSVYANNTYADSGLLFKEADANGKVVIKTDQSFIKELKIAGVIDSVHADKTIKIYPVFDQKRVNVNFENTDRDDNDPQKKNQYNANYLCSYMKNVIEACSTGTVSYKVYEGLEHYQMNVPYGSVIRVQSVPASNRTPAGISIWKLGDQGSTIQYYKKGATTFSGLTPTGDVIEETDYTKADVVADRTLTVIKPATGSQSFFIGYSPKTKNFILNEEDPDNPGEKLVTTLENAVIDTSGGYHAAGIENAQKSNADGSMWLNSPYIGKKYTFTANAPNGYYVSWANMTGDINNDGTIDTQEEVQSGARSNRSRSKNPTYVYGNKLDLTLDMDSTRYYYEFLPKAVNLSVPKTGTVKREVNTFYNLSKGLKSKDYIPVSAAQVNIAGFYTMTNGLGEYSLMLPGLPSWGTVSASIFADDLEYTSTASIEAPTNIIIPALEAFDAKEISAYYDSRSYIADDYITITNDTLNVDLKVSSDTLIRPDNARFYIYNSEGVEIINCSDASESDTYQTAVQKNDGILTASLKFNPKTDLKNGYKLYVSFADQNGHWYTPIDTGYTFFAELTVEEFVFPMIGSSILNEDDTDKDMVIDVIGNPLGNLSIGSIDGFDVSPERYTPEAAKGTPYEDEFTWNRTSYQFGWSKSFGDSMKSSSQSNEEKMKKMVNNIQSDNNTGKKANSSSKYSTNSKFSWSVTPSVGFSLTLSQRNPAENKQYFEDLVFFVKVDFGISSSNKIALPIGLSVAIDASLGGNVTGVYHMYVDYADSFETEDKAAYDTASFGLFKKFNNNIRREGYIFLNPKVSVAVGVGVAIAFVKIHADFDFDMDFQFTEASTNAYGDVTFNMAFTIDIAGFEVYRKDVLSKTEKMFGTPGIDGHIEFDTANLSAMLSDYTYESLMEGGEFSATRTVDRSYLENRSAWHGNADEVQLMSTENEKGTTEAILQEGVSNNPKIELTPYKNAAGQTKMLMVYTDDAPERPLAENKRAVYYTIGDGTGWTEPQIIYDDGTLDDYPHVQDLGNGQLIVSWSSMNTAVNADEIRVDEALCALEIQTTFFDTATETFGEVEQLTHITDRDNAGDVMPMAAFDPTSGRIIMYYVKKNLDPDEENLSNILDGSDSYLAYRFYKYRWDTEQNKWSSGQWNDASDYANTMFEPAEDWSADRINKYKEDFYGQWFVPLIRTRAAEGANIIDSDLISYNGLALYAYTTDSNSDLASNDDCHICLSIYSFAENQFVYTIRMTKDAGYYAAPKFARSGNSTYLFFGAKDPDSETAEIRYFNVTDIVKRGKFNKNEFFSDSPFYELYYALDENGEVKATNVSNPDKIYVEPAVATTCDSLTDYDVVVSNDGKMYLFWPSRDEDGTEIVASVYTAGDAEQGLTRAEEPNYELDQKEYFWSKPIALTDGGENTYYAGLGASVIDGKIYICGTKANYVNAADTKLTMQTHIPYKKVVVSDITVESEYPRPGSAADVTVTLKNEGLLQHEDPITVTLDVNGTTLTKTYAQTIPGGAEVRMSFDAMIPTDAQDVTIKAYIGEDDVKSKALTFESKLMLGNDAITENTDENGDTFYTYTASLANEGNAASGAVTFTATIGEGESEKTVGTYTVDSVARASAADIRMPITLSDSDYTITDGEGKAMVRIKAVSGEAVISETTHEMTKQFDANAIAWLSNLTDVVFEAENKTYSADPGDILTIQPTFEGVEEGKLRVEWLDSSNGHVAYVDYSNAIIAEGGGTTTLTGIVVPTEETIDFTSGTGERMDWRTQIPKDLQKEVSVTLNVTTPVIDNNENENGNGNSGGNRVNGTGGGNNRLNSIYAPSNNTLPFKDVLAHEWYYDAVMYAYQNGLFNGVDENNFAPNDFLTRAMLVTVLWRADGMPQIAETPNFADVDTQDYYYPALCWAVKNGIIKGVSETEFAPNDLILREQIAAIMFRYAQYKGYDVSVGENTNILSYADYDAISEYAVEALQYAVGSGLMQGKTESTLNPQDNATRAESAAILQRFYENLAK